MQETGKAEMFQMAQKILGLEPRAAYVSTFHTYFTTLLSLFG